MQLECRRKSTNLQILIWKSKEDLLKILKNYRDLQESALKVSRDNLNNFGSNSTPLKGPIKSFKDASEGEVKSQDFNENLNEDQFKAE